MTTPRRMIGAAAALAFLTSLAAASPMEVSSSSFADGATIPAMHASDAAGCGGQGVSPQVTWRALPPAAKSVAVLFFDPDGGSGAGTSHLVAYNIAASRQRFEPGEMVAGTLGLTLGKNSGGTNAYRGMCPPVGDLPHHYVLTVIASELDPGTLAGGLDRDQLLAALKGHTLQSQSVIGRYAR